MYKMYKVNAYRTAQFTYSACRLLTKMKERTQTFNETVDSRNIYITTN